MRKATKGNSMKACPDFLLKEIAGDYMLIPVGKQYVDFAAMITLNETGAFLWKCLQEDCSQQQLVSALCGEYEIDEATAQSDVSAFVEMLSSNGMLQE